MWDTRVKNQRTGFLYHRTSQGLYQAISAVTSQWASVRVSVVGPGLWAGRSPSLFLSNTEPSKHSKNHVRKTHLTWVFAIKERPVRIIPAQPSFSIG